MRFRKTAVCTAVAGALALPGGANAEVEIYGTASAALESLDNDATNKSPTEVSNNHSAFGVKGSVDVGDGLKGVFLYDAFVGLDDGASSNGPALIGEGRDGYVGIAGGFGTVALGYHGRPWKTSTDRLDLFGSTIADYSAIMGTTPGGEYFDAGIGNSILYFSPSFNGLKVHAQFGADEADDGSNDLGVQVNYTSGPLYVTVSHDVDGQAGGNDVSATKLAGSYQLGSTTVIGMFESIADGNLNSRGAYYFGASHDLGAVKLKAAFAVAEDSDAGGADDGATYIAVGADHRYTENLTTYILFSSISNDNGGMYQYISAPHTSSNGNTTVTAGKDSAVFAVGFKYDFSWKSGSSM